MQSSISIVSFLQRFSSVILNPIILLMFALSFLYFVYGVFKFLSLDMNAVDKSRQEARDSIIWGIVGMVIMFSVFGLIRFVLDTFGISPSDINSSGAKGFLGL